MLEILLSKNNLNVISNEINFVLELTPYFSKYFYFRSDDR